MAIIRGSNAVLLWLKVVTVTARVTARVTVISRVKVRVRVRVRVTIRFRVRVTVTVTPAVRVRKIMSNCRAVWLNTMSRERSKTT